ncbi:hypothetical protein IF125_03630 [Empedobacter stercoris]|uniref:hypothetical protein n=1 Tax=Empedobacter stercoris TaxID=1628248 RepID=UPI001CE07743|nr:hypothetical protein [Empedobacter stercoris]MCA4781351.1 hypothetical protein [Empedobacter stercoris]
MKKILSGFFFLALISAQAQSVTDYKYVIVPDKFTDFAKEDYQLNTALKIALKKKEFEIVNEKSIPLDIQINPCLAAKANIENTSVAFRNKLKVTFSDCNNTVFDSYEGISKEKEFAKGYQEAFSVAMSHVKKQNAKALPLTKIEKRTSITTETIKPKEDVIAAKKDIAEADIYKLDGKNYIKTVTKNNEFVLIDKHNSKVIAQFYPASQQNVYHVTVISANGNYETIGYTNDQNIIIEYKTADKSWSTTTYTK